MLVLDLFYVFFLGVLSSLVIIFREDRYGIIDRYDLIKITVVI